MRWPVTQPIRSDAMAATAAPMSSGWPTWPIAITPPSWARTYSSSRSEPPPKSVPVAPGAMALTVIRRGPSSWAR